MWLLILHSRKQFVLLADRGISKQVRAMLTSMSSASHVMGGLRAGQHQHSMFSGLIAQSRNVANKSTQHTVQPLLLCKW